MMLKKINLVALAILSSAQFFVVKAQDATITNGPRITNATAILLQKKIDENNILVIAENGSKVNARSVSADNLMDNSAPNAILGDVDVKGKKSKGLDIKKYKFENVIDLGEKTIAFFVQGGKKKDSGTKIYAIEIDNEGQMKDAPVELAANNQKKKGGLFSSDAPTGFRVIVSENHKKFAIISQDADVKGKSRKDASKPGVVNIKVYDETFNSIGEKTADFEIDNFAGGALLSNEGFVSCIANVIAKTNKEAKKLKKEGEATHHMSIVGIDVAGQSDEVIHLPIKLKSKEIIDCGAAYQKGDLICTGTYSELGKKGKSSSTIEGFFYARLDTKTGEAITQSYKKLDKGTVELLGGPKASKNKKGKGITKRYSLKQILHLENGSTSIILETNWAFSQWYRTAFYITVYHTVYVSGNCIVINLNKEGDMNNPTLLKNTFEVLKDIEKSISEKFNSNLLILASF